jgi:hypothetical protein
MMRAEKEAGEVKPARKSLSPPKACIDHLSGAGYAPHAALQARQVGHGDDIDVAQRDIDALDAVAVGAGRDDLQGLGRRSYLT